MFLVVNSNHIRFQNLMIYSTNPLQTGIEFADSGPSNPTPNPLCTGAKWSSSKNSLDHVTMQGVGLNGLLYGVVFSSSRYGYNGNNDMSTLVDTTFYNVTNAAVKIEPTNTNSHQHRLISVNGYGAPGNHGCFVDAQTGFFSSTGGFQGGWGDANFCIDGAYGPFDIIESNSEGSNRLVRAGAPGHVTSFPLTLNIRGGRFAVDGAASDGRVIDFNRMGPLTIRGLRFDGTPPSGVQPHIAMLPSVGPGSPWKAKAFIDDVAFFVPNSDTWDTLVFRNFIDILVLNLVCSDSSGNAVDCASTTPLAVP
jgi:hypothetical protein